MYYVEFYKDQELKKVEIFDNGIKKAFKYYEKYKNKKLKKYDSIKLNYYCTTIKEYNY